MVKSGSKPYNITERHVVIDLRSCFMFRLEHTRLSVRSRRLHLLFRGHHPGRSWTRTG